MSLLAVDNINTPKEELQSEEFQYIEKALYSLLSSFDWDVYDDLMNYLSAHPDLASKSVNYFVPTADIKYNELWKKYHRMVA